MATDGQHEISKHGCYIAEGMNNYFIIKKLMKYLPLKKDLQIKNL
jgi:hypothetical protein